MNCHSKLTMCVTFFLPKEKPTTIHTKQKQKKLEKYLKTLNLGPTGHVVNCGMTSEGSKNYLKSLHTCPTEHAKNCSMADGGSEN